MISDVKYGGYFRGVRRWLEPSDSIEEALEIACEIVKDLNDGPKIVHIGECIFREPEVNACDVIEYEQIRSGDVIDEDGYLEFVTTAQINELERELADVFKVWMYRHRLQSNQYTIDEHMYSVFVCYDDHWAEFPSL